jgi:hypothetical protein
MRASNVATLKWCGVAKVENKGETRGTNLPPDEEILERTEAQPCRFLSA